MSRLAKIICVAAGLLSASPSLAASTALPKSVQRALDRAIAIGARGPPTALGQLAGGNAKLSSDIVLLAVTRRPDLAARIAAAAAGNVPQVAPQLAAAAATADPKAAAEIAAAVTLAVPAARAAVADAVVGSLPPNDRMAAAGRIHAAVDAAEGPSLDDPD